MFVLSGLYTSRVEGLIDLPLCVLHRVTLTGCWSPAASSRTVTWPLGASCSKPDTITSRRCLRWVKDKTLNTTHLKLWFICCRRRSSVWTAERARWSCRHSVDQSRAEQRWLSAWETVAATCGRKVRRGPSFRYDHNWTCFQCLTQRWGFSLTKGKRSSCNNCSRAVSYVLFTCTSPLTASIYCVA